MSRPPLREARIRIAIGELEPKSPIDRSRAVSSASGLSGVNAPRGSVLRQPGKRERERELSTLSRRHSRRSDGTHEFEDEQRRPALFAGEGESVTRAAAARTRRTRRYEQAVSPSDTGGGETPPPPISARVPLSTAAAVAAAAVVARYVSLYRLRPNSRRATRRSYILRASCAHCVLPMHLHAHAPPPEQVAEKLESDAPPIKGKKNRRSSHRDVTVTIASEIIAPLIFPLRKLYCHVCWQIKMTNGQR